MNRRHLLALLACVLGWALTPRPVAAQSIPSALKGSTSVPANQVTPFIDAQFKALAGTDADAQRQARNNIAAEFKDGSQAPGAVFATTYIQAANDAAVALLESNPTIRVKVNVGVALTNLGDTAHSVKMDASLTKLEPAVMGLLQDKSDAVKLWGLRASRYVLVGLVAINAGQKMMDQIVADAKGATTSTGPIAEEAADAFGGFFEDPQKARNAPEAIAKPLLELARYRIDQYKTGIPEDPQSDYKPISDLMAMWSKLSAQERTESMQDVVDLLSLAAQRGDDAQAHAVRDQLQRTISQTAASLFQVFANDKPMFEKANQVYKQAQANAVNLTALTKFLTDGIREMPEFKGLKPAPAPAPLPMAVGP